MDSLRLIAVDADDLAILSAHCQDAVLKIEDIRYEPRKGRFLFAMNRFAWERAGAKRRVPFFGKPHNERRRSVLHFERVLGVRRTGFTAASPNQVLSLLALQFTPAEAPAGAITLVFSGGSAIRLEVECIEARLSDLGSAWSARSRPVHRADAPAS